MAADSGEGDGLIYISTNHGTSWKATLAPNDFWAAIASSADGTKWVAADSGYGDGLIYVSTNAGGSWAPTTAPSEYWTSVAASSDASRSAVTSYPAGIYTWQYIPVLDIKPSSGDLFISWPSLSSTTGYSLQEGSNLTGSTWIAVTNISTLTNGQNQVVIPLQLSGNKFFRLDNS